MSHDAIVLRLRNEFCRVCRAVPGELCVDVVKFMLYGRRKEIRDPARWHSVEVSPQLRSVPSEVQEHQEHAQSDELSRALDGADDDDKGPAD